MINPTVEMSSMESSQSGLDAIDNSRETTPPKIDKPTENTFLSKTSISTYGDEERIIIPDVSEVIYIHQFQSLHT